MAHETTTAIQHVNGESTVITQVTPHLIVIFARREGRQQDGEAYTVQYLIGGQSSMPTSSEAEFRVWARLLPDGGRFVG